MDEAPKTPPRAIVDFFNRDSPARDGLCEEFRVVPPFNQCPRFARKEVFLSNGRRVGSFCNTCWGSQRVQVFVQNLQAPFAPQQASIREIGGFAPLRVGAQAD